MIDRRAGVFSETIDSSKYKSESSFGGNETIPIIIQPNVTTGNARIYSVTLPYNPVLIAPGEMDVQSFEFADTEIGDIILGAFNRDLVGIQLLAYVAQAGLINVQFCNITDEVLNLPEGNIKLSLIK